MLTRPVANQKGTFLFCVGTLAACHGLPPVGCHRLPNAIKPAATMTPTIQPSNRPESTPMIQTASTAPIRVIRLQTVQAIHCCSALDNVFMSGLMQRDGTTAFRRVRRWTNHVARLIIAVMRFILLSLLFFVSACGGDPRSLGITGAASPVPAPDPGEVTTGVQGMPATGTQYAPSLGPNTGGGKFWGYN